MINFLLNIMLQLKDLPGFGFVGPYYYKLFSKVQMVLDKKGDMEEVAKGAMIGVKVVANAPKKALSAKGSKKRN